jgi:hypothetical protein
LLQNFKYDLQAIAASANVSIEDYFRVSYQAGLRIKTRVEALLCIKSINDKRMREEERAEAKRRKLNVGSGTSSSSSSSSAIVDILSSECVAEKVAQLIFQMSSELIALKDENTSLDDEVASVKDENKNQKNDISKLIGMNLDASRRENEENEKSSTINQLYLDGVRAEERLTAFEL